MKKIFQLLIAGLSLTVIMGGCDVNDKFDGLDDLTKPTNVVSYTYTLTSIDYSTIGTRIQKPIADTIALYQDSLKDALTAEDSARFTSAIETLKLDPTYLLGATVKSSQYLTSSATSEDWIPVVLNSIFPYVDVNSKAQVTYNYNLNDLGYLAAFENATAYTVSAANYTSVGGKVSLLGAFTPSYPAANFIPAFLEASVTNPTEGQIAVATYNATTIEPSMDDIPVTITEFSDDFESGTLDNFVNYNVTGDPVWTISTYGGTSFAKISGYVSGTGNVENEDWLILPSVDLSGAVAASVSFSTAHKYAGNDLVLKYSTDYDGSSNPSTATWTDLSYNFEAGTGTYAWTPSGNVNLSGMPNSNVSIAFVYTSTADASSTWEIDNVVVSYKNLNSNIPVLEYKDCFKYTSSNWVKTSSVDCVSPFEYEQMGISGGCFTSDILPEYYLPIYLQTKYPFAVEGDTTVVVYNYGSVTSPKVDKYIYSSGTWSAYTGVIAQTDPFAYTSSIGWKYNNTDILLSLNSSTGISSNIGDFTIISVLGDNQTWKWDDTYGAKMSGYSSGYFDNEDWLVSPPMDLTERGDSIFLTFDHAGNYFGSTAGMMETAKVMISTTSDGVTIKESDWTELPLEAVDYPAGTNWTYVTTSPIKLSTYAGKSGVRIAFKYISTADPQLAGTWEIKNLHVYEKE